MPRLIRTPCIERWIGHEVLVLLPAGGPVHRLAPTAAIVWQALTIAEGEQHVDGVLAEHYPQIPAAERQDTLAEILGSLHSDGLVTID